METYLSYMFSKHNFTLFVIDKIPLIINVLICNSMFLFTYPNVLKRLKKMDPPPKIVSLKFMYYYFYEWLMNHELQANIDLIRETKKTVLRVLKTNLKFDINTFNRSKIIIISFSCTSLQYNTLRHIDRLMHSLNYGLISKLRNMSASDITIIKTL